MTDFLTIIAGGYNIKVSRENSIIRISMPNHVCEINLESDEKDFNEEFLDALERTGWKSTAIRKLRQYVLSGQWDSGCVEINKTNGKIKY